MKDILGFKNLFKKEIMYYDEKASDIQLAIHYLKFEFDPKYQRKFAMGVCETMVDVIVTSKSILEAMENIDTLYRYYYTRTFKYLPVFTVEELREMAIDITNQRYAWLIGNIDKRTTDLNTVYPMQSPIK